VTDEPEDPAERQNPAPGGFDWGLGSAAASQPAPASPPLPEPLPEPLPSPEPTPAPAPEPPTEALAVTAPEPDAADPLGSLFHDTSFKDYEDESVTGQLPGAGIASPPVAKARRPKGAPLPRNQRILLWVAGSLVAVLLLVGLFFAGTRLPALLGPAPAVAVSKTPTPTPTPTQTPVAGPVAVGLHKWSELRGGECLSPFSTVWAETFTVIDCATPHPAQLVFRGTFPATIAAPVAAPSTSTPAPTATAAPGGYPGVAALQAQINLLCTAPGVINLAAAGAYTDIQFQGAYAADAKEWMSGQHDYFCFVTRSSGQPLTASVATPPAAG
jgi:hypothetical protein